MLSAIERATRQKIERLELPTTETVNNKRIADFKQKITDTLALGELAFMQNLVEQYRNEHDVPSLDIAAALAKLTIGDKPLLLAPDKDRKARRFEEKSARGKDDKPRGKGHRNKSLPEPDSDKQRYRIEVGHEHGVKPGNIVGAIANEAGLDGEHIGHIEIDQQYSLVDLPVGMPRDIFMDLKKVRVCGRPMKISLLEKPDRPKARKRKKSKRRS
jgi:ATP-dependent RNA helicase DeaD